jgi:hypothetical protein
VVLAQIYPQVFRFTPNTPSTAAGTLVGSITASSLSNGPPSCVLDGKLFWAAGGAGQFGSANIMSCTLGNCAATTQIVRASPGAVPADQPFCDQTTDELVWDDYTGIGGAATGTDWIVTIYRMASNGNNFRAITNFLALGFSYPNGYFSDMGIPRGAADKWFFSREDSTSLVTTLYYVSTSTVSGTPISIGTGTYAGNQYTQWTNDAQYAWVDGNTLAKAYSVPLPNGVTGMPPTFYSGGINDGIMDSQNFYGVFSGLPSDAIGTCPVSNCTNPTILFRGQQGAGAFTQDASAIYWTTSVTNSGYTVWEAAK